ncbi:c-type cytochrome [Pseudomonas corrugata]|uniref:C-type cytochrome n=2 Tax=Pseudomonas corrugata TaxID=47879 RepID=A0A7Y5ZC72_9PSED|nr:c-type cytochrome [Pseudomonas corrugata]
MEVCGMTRSISLTLTLCMATLVGCTGTTDRPPEKTATTPALVLVDDVCSLCHGLTGESISPMFPKLAGQQKDYLKVQLTDFKGHARMDKAATQYMWGFTHLTESQIAELADYFSGQRPMQAEAETPDARGELIFRQGVPESNIAPCSTCHGAVGQGLGQTPRVAGQHAAYMVRQIKLLQQADLQKRRDPASQIAHALSDGDAQSVALYMARLGR